MQYVLNAILVLYLIYSVRRLIASNRLFHTMLPLVGESYRCSSEASRAIVCRAPGLDAMCAAGALDLFLTVGIELSHGVLVARTNG